MKGDNIDLYKNFLDLETKKLTSLQADIRLYKVKKDRYVPFYFPTAAQRVTRQSVLETGTTSATVIKNFDVQYTGTDPFTASRSLQCSMTLFTDNIKNLFIDPPSGYAKTVELFTIFRNKTVKMAEGMKIKKKVPASQLKKSRSAQIAVTLGYDPPPVGSPLRRMFTSDELTAIKNSKLSLRLTYVDHTISVQENGSANIDIKFIGRFSSIVRDPVYDLMSTTSDIIERSKLSDELKRLNKKPEKNKTKILKIQSDIAVANRIQFRQYLANLEDKGLIYDEDVTIEQIQGFKRYGLMGAELKRSLKEDLEQKKGRLDNVALTVRQEQGMEGLARMEKPNASARARGLAPVRERDGIYDDYADAVSIYENLFREVRTVSYFHLGDLIAAVVEQTHNRIENAIAALDVRSKLLSDEDFRFNTSFQSSGLDKEGTSARITELQKALQDLENFKIMFASVQIAIAEDRERSINLADIPISLGLYQKFVFTKIEQNHVVKYGFDKFLTDCITYLIPQALKGHVVIDAPFLKADVSVKSFEVSGENIDNSKITIRSKNLPSMLKRIPAKNLRDQTDYLVVYSEQATDTNLSRSGNRIRDHKDGIYHFHIGRDRGVLKSISFSKQETPYRKEALMLESVSLYDQLKMPYNVSLEMFGNSMFLPGSLIYVDPSNIGLGSGRSKNSAAFQLGLGGYYTLINIQTNYSDGTMRTTATGIFNSWAETDTGILEELSSYPGTSESSPGRTKE